MDTAFTHLLAMLGGIADPRRAEGKLYGLPHVFLFSILAVMAGANSYRAIHSFIDVPPASAQGDFRAELEARAGLQPRCAGSFRVLRRATSRPCSVCTHRS